MNSAIVMTKPTSEGSFKRSAFAVLGKRKALDEANENGRPPKKSSTSKVKQQDSQQLTQLQLAVGQVVQKKCDICNMSYIVSSAEDRKLHDDFHSRHTDGYDVGRSFVDTSDSARTFIVGSDHICVIDCFDKPYRRRRAQAALDLVQKDLGAVEIKADKLWDSKALPASHLARTRPLFRAYMYVRVNRCIGYLLVREIRQAHVVIQTERRMSLKPRAPALVGPTTALAALRARQLAALEHKEYIAGQPISLSEYTHPARFGVSRVWTAHSHRKEGVATRLLDTALKHQCKLDEELQHLRDAERRERTKSKSANDISPRRFCEKEDFAFSQPTVAGTRLARKWFGKDFDWKVYLDVD